jgi:hypothetical protein
MLADTNSSSFLKPRMGKPHTRSEYRWDFIEADSSHQLVFLYGKKPFQFRQIVKVGNSNQDSERGLEELNSTLEILGSLSTTAAIW